MVIFHFPFPQRNIMARMTKKYSRKGKTTKKKRMVKPGFTRRSGYYGRYNGTPGWEKKWFDSDIPATQIPVGGSVFNSFNLVPQNTTSSGRIGRKITITDLHFNYYLLKGAQSAYTGFRVTVLLDKQCNGAAAAQGDVFQIAGDLTSYPNLANTGRFVFLYDKYIEVSAQTVATSTIAATVTTTNTTGVVNRHYKWSKRVNIPIEFSDAAVSIATVKSNNLFLIVQQASGGAADSSIDGVFRIRYSDS